MARSKIKKTKWKEQPGPKGTVYSANPDGFYQNQPSWKFHLRDKEYWPFTKENVGADFWDKILLCFQNWETQTWRQILVDDKKNNHSIIVGNINKIAQDRIQSRLLECESIISLRLDGTHRLYGIIDGSSFCIIWYDKDHGDNDTCVCRSYMKHT